MNIYFVEIFGKLKYILTTKYNIAYNHKFRILMPDIILYSTV